MNIEYLRDFLCVCETMNLTAAADLRNTTQSNLSKRIRNLETWLGRELIDRNNRPMTLTSEGESMVPRARRILIELETFRGVVAPWEVSAGGIRISLPHSATIEVFPRFKMWLLQRMPEAQFAARIANHDMVAGMLHRSECDLALGNRHPAVPQAEEFAVFKSVLIARDSLVLVEPTDIADNENLPTFVSHRGTYIGKIWQHGKPAEVSGPEREMGMAADIRTHCLAGLGRGVLPLSLIEGDIALGRLVRCETVQPIDYDFLLYCAPQAGPQARKVWTIAEERFGAVTSPN